MLEIGSDILYFDEVMPEELINEMCSLVEINREIIFNRDLRHAQFPFEGIRGRIEVYKYPELLEKFNNFWYDKIENQMYDYYFKYLNNLDVSSVFTRKYSSSKALSCGL